jgi:cell division transport system permease protein
LLIVGNTVKLAIFARREEIEIMQLVGAPSAVIRMPFVIEGMIQGCAGAALSLLLLGLLFLALKSQLPLTEILIDRGQLKFLAPESAALLLVLGVAMGAFGSFFSLGRFLPKW